MASLTRCSVFVFAVHMHLLCLLRPEVLCFPASRIDVTKAVPPQGNKHDTAYTPVFAGKDYFCFESKCRCNSTVADCSGNEGNLTFVPKLPPGVVFLDFSNNNVSEIGDDFFLNATNINGLDLSHNKLAVIHSEAFGPLAKLDTLVLNDNPGLSYTTLVPVLTIPRLKTLHLENLKLGPLPSGLFFGYPQRHLENLDLQNNSLGDVNLSVFAPMDSLRVLNLSDNKITVLHADAPTTIEVLNMQGNSIDNFPETCRAGSSLFPELKSLILNNNSIATIPDQVCLPKLRVLNLSYNSLTTLKTGMFETQRFPSLKELYLDVSDDIYMESKKLYIENASFANEGLDLISLSGSRWYLDSNAPLEHVFYGCQNLSSLVMSGKGQNDDAWEHNCLFTHAVKDDKHKSNQLFSPLPYLKHLDVASCGVRELSTITSVDQLRSLEVLILSGNDIGDPATHTVDGTGVTTYGGNTVRFLNGVFDSFDSLVYLDLSYNQIPYVTESMFSVKTFRRIRHLDFSGNPFECSCDILALKNWLTMYIHSPLLDSPRTTYTCSWNNTQIPVVSYSVPVMQTCLYPVLIFTILMFFIFVTITCTCCFGCCRWCRNWCDELNRMRRYTQPVDYEIFRPPINQRLARMRREDFQYDVFVSYASEDEGFLNEHLIPQLEGRLGLKLCLHERDFHPGKEIMANITDNLDVSRRAMLIFSTEFARSRWCQFELTLCMTHVMDNADVMLVVCLGELPNVELTTNMEAVLRTSTYLQWSNEPHAMGRFWRRLESALRAP